MAGRHRQSRSSLNWMLTFTDVTVLLITFFVLLFSMSTVRTEEWRTVVTTLNSTLQTTDTTSDPKVSASLNIPTTIDAQAIDLEYLASVLQEKMAQNPVLDRAVLQKTSDRLMLSLPSEMLFGAGSAELGETGREAVFLLGGVLGNIENRVEVQGHSDPSPLIDSPYVSNWELSLARAMAVVRELRRSGYDREVVILGLGDSRFASLSQTMPELRRLELARRVDVVIRPSGDQ